MATLYISEYDRVAQAGPFGMPMGYEPAKSTQTVAVGGSSTQSAAFGAVTAYVRVHTDVVCSVALGSNPTATVAMARMAANQTEYFAVRSGDKIAVISNT